MNILKILGMISGAAGTALVGGSLCSKNSSQASKISGALIGFSGIAIGISNYMDGEEIEEREYEKMIKEQREKELIETSVLK